MSEIIPFKNEVNTDSSLPPEAKAILIQTMEELREAMTETLGYASMMGCDVDHIRGCIKVMVDDIEIETKPIRKE